MFIALLHLLNILVKNEIYAALFLDDSPETMNGVLQELDFFANISGLKINF